MGLLVCRNHRRNGAVPRLEVATPQFADDKSQAALKETTVGDKAEHKGKRMAMGKFLNTSLPHPRQKGT